MREVLQGYDVEGIIFDMDGVLADVSRSYRQAILQTAASFGAPITSLDIAAAKAKGKANNDWILTLRLITEYQAQNKASAQYTVVWKQESLLYAQCRKSNHHCQRRKK